MEWLQLIAGKLKRQRFILVLETIIVYCSIRDYYCLFQYQRLSLFILVLQTIIVYCSIRDYYVYFSIRDYYCLFQYQRLLLFISVLETIIVYFSIRDYYCLLQYQRLLLFIVVLETYCTKQPKRQLYPGHLTTLILHADSDISQVSVCQ